MSSFPCPGPPAGMAARFGPADVCHQMAVSAPILFLLAPVHTTRLGCDIARSISVFYTPHVGAAPPHRSSDAEFGTDM